MASLVLILIGFVCLITSRILLIGASFGVSKTWGFVVLFVPFGPTFFRMNYRELSARSGPFRLGTIICFVLAGALGRSPAEAFRTGFHKGFQSRVEAKDEADVPENDFAPAAAPDGTVSKLANSNQMDLDKLQKWYTSLSERRKNLAAMNQEAIVSFNAEAAQYQAALRDFRAQKAQLVSLPR